MNQRILEINLFGACVVRGKNLVDFELSGAKHQALIVLLATAPLGRRTRAYLQDTLWGTACYDSGRQSLRRALSDIKSIAGIAFSELLTATNSDITLDLSKVEFIGRPGGNDFMEGVDIKEERFNEWLQSVRINPAQVHALFGPPSQGSSHSILPVVAVMAARSGPTRQDHTVLGDWLAEEICRSLSRSNLLSVISHLSSRTLSLSTPDIEAVRTRLQADYCITGNLRSDGDVIQFDADFINAHSGRIIWTRRFTGSLSDFISNEAPGLAHIVHTVGATIADEAIRHVNGRKISSIDDHALLIAGVGLMHRQTLKEFARSREMLTELLSRAPRSAEANAWLGKWYVLSVFNGWTTDAARDTQMAIDQTARALDIDPHSAFALTVDGFAQNNLLRRLDIAASRYAEALRTNPNEALCWLLTGALKAFNGQPKEAVICVDKARSLSPIDPFGYYFKSLSATAYLSGMRNEEALGLANDAMKSNSRHLSTHRVRITALHNLGRYSEARAAAAELLRLRPDYTVAHYKQEHPAAQMKLGRNVAEALRAAEIPAGGS